MIGIALVLARVLFMIIEVLPGYTGAASLFISSGVLDAIRRGSWNALDISLLIFGALLFMLSTAGRLVVFLSGNVRRKARAWFFCGYILVCNVEIFSAGLAEYMHQQVQWAHDVRAPYDKSCDDLSARIKTAQTNIEIALAQQAKQDTTVPAIRIHEARQSNESSLTQNRVLETKLSDQLTRLKANPPHPFVAHWERIKAWTLAAAATLLISALIQFAINQAKPDDDNSGAPAGSARNPRPSDQGAIRIPFAMALRRAWRAISTRMFGAAAPRFPEGDAIAVASSASLDDRQLLGDDPRRVGRDTIKGDGAAPRRAPHRSRDNDSRPSEPVDGAGHDGRGGFNAQAAQRDRDGRQSGGVKRTAPGRATKPAGDRRGPATETGSARDQQFTASTAAGQAMRPAPDRKNLTPQARAQLFEQIRATTDAIPSRRAEKLFGFDHSWICKIRNGQAKG